MSTRKTLKEFEKIYENTYSKTLKYIICKCSNLNDVNDIIQDTYTEFYKALKEKKEIKDKQAFIIGIARNKIKKYISSKTDFRTTSIFQKNEDDEVIIDIDARIDIELDFINRNTIDDIWKYLKNKDEITAKIFYLYFVLDMKLKDIAKELERNESTIKSNLYRTLKGLRKKFGGE